ncbi:MAG: LuxR C-terminal-related transcriptional regulator [Planctomycetota bacterium]|nr:LuxR C-terminal-related transcriptional regulator [Planctomycetota bacterium]
MQHAPRMIEIAPSVQVPVAFFEGSTTAMTITREDGLVIYMNGAARDIMLMDGKPIGWVGMSLLDMQPREFWEERVALLRRLARTEQNGVVRDLFGGEQVIVHLRLLPHKPGDPLRYFLVLLHKQHGPVTEEQFPDDVVFHDAKVQHLGPLALLSPRELEVLALVGEGLSAAQIAERIHRSEDTVNTHKASLLRKLNCQNATQLAIIANRAGLKFDDSERIHG